MRSDAAADVAVCEGCCQAHDLVYSETRLTHKAVAQLFMRKEAPCIEHGPPEGKGVRFFGELGIRELAKEWHYWVECG